MGCSVGGRVSQTRGVTFSAPNSTVLLIGISRCEMRPVTLSSAANTAIGFLILLSAEAGGGAHTSDTATDASTTPKPARGAAKSLPRFMLPHTV